MRIAITGGVGEGKSTVLGLVGAHGLRTLSADEVAREVLSEPDVSRKVERVLGEPYRPERVRERITREPDLRRQINAVTHPEILRRLLERSAGEPTAIEVPLLIEACIQRFFDQTWVVTCGPEEQMRRVAERLGDEQAARELIDAQLPTPVKCAFADRVVRTDCPLPIVHRTVVEALADLGLVKT